jgi:hypothetical protein
MKKISKWNFICIVALLPIFKYYWRIFIFLWEEEGVIVQHTFKIYTKITLEDFVDIALYPTNLYVPAIFELQFMQIFQRNTPFLIIRQPSSSSCMSIVSASQYGSRRHSKMAQARRIFLSRKKYYIKNNIRFSILDFHHGNKNKDRRDRICWVTEPKLNLSGDIWILNKFCGKQTWTKDAEVSLTQAIGQRSWNFFHTPWWFYRI